MADTLLVAIAKVQRYFPDATSEIITDLLNDIHSELNEQYALRVTEEGFTALTTTDREYSLSEEVLAVWSAVYHSSATASHRLTETSIDELDEESGNWRALASGTPRRFYLSTNTTGAVLGLHPRPDTASSSGYPKVVLHVSKRDSLGSGESLPASLRSSRVYVVGACWLYAEQMYPDRAPMFEAAYLREKGKLGVYMMRRQRRNHPTIMPRWIQRSRRI
jgi:hypothetical protein